MQCHDQFCDVLLNPTLIVAVLSPSTEACDRGAKFWRYRTWLPTLTDYLLVAQDKPLIDHDHHVEQQWKRKRWRDRVLWRKGGFEFFDQTPPYFASHTISKFSCSLSANVYPLTWSRTPWKKGVLARPIR